MVFDRECVRVNHMTKLLTSEAYDNPSPMPPGLGGVSSFTTCCTLDTAGGAPPRTRRRLLGGALRAFGVDGRA